MMTADNINVDGVSDKLLDRLISVMGDEAVLFEQFLELLERQQQALIVNDTDELKTVTTQLQRVVLQSQRLEQQRIETVKEIRRAGGADGDLTVSEICDMADPRRSVRLQAFRTTILDLYGKIEEARMRNGLLIEQSLEQIQNTIDMIGRIPMQKQGYRKHGGVSKDFQRLGVDRRV
jgi:flagellar biosynthesis/type III secretory pathway chaperone